MTGENVNEGNKFQYGIAAPPSLDLQDISACKIHVSNEYVTMLQHEIEKQQHELESLKKSVQALQDELDTAQEITATLYDAAPVGYISLNSKGIIQHGNRMLASLLNVERSALVQQPFSSYVHDEDQMEWFDFLHRKEDNHPLHRSELRLFRKDHGWFFAELRCLHDADKSPMRLVLLADIAERKAIEEKAATQQLQLFQASQMASMGVLAAGVAHEINNPNFLIMLNIPLLKMIWNDVRPVLDQYYEAHGNLTVANRPYPEMRESVFEMLSEMMQGSERIKEIVQELGDFAKEPSWDLHEQTDINTIVMASIILLARVIKDSTQCFHVAYAPNLPPIRGCVQRLEQVVVNVILNACQALPDKTCAIFISTTLETETNAVIIEVRDEGIGISAEKLSKVQDPFYTTRRELGRGGMGLAISSSIMREHGGRIEFVSEEGKGTTVRILFPPLQQPT